MTPKSNSARVVLISQWPKVKNAEYELINKIRQTGFKTAVVDYFGFDVDTGKCINDATLIDEYDFAISFHYDTPKFLNIPTFLWVANPLEYMHLRGDYRSVLIHHCRAYDDYLYNGSDLLEEHIKRIVGDEWRKTSLSFFASCARSAMLEPHGLGDQPTATSNKIFYCGVNWERGLDKAGRAQGLLDILQEKQAADFYGPRMLEGVSTWDGFSSYRGEIPFDGISMSHTMQNYGAVLAVSSPAHLKSRTSSSRVFEGFAAGVPVISDENPHVRKLFGDLVYYFSGPTEQDRARSILDALDRIRANPKEAIERVREAQAKISKNYCFDECITRILKTLSGESACASNASLVARNEVATGPTIDVFLFHHDPYVVPATESVGFKNIPYLLKSACAAVDRHRAKVRIFHYALDDSEVPAEIQGCADVEWISLNENQLEVADWRHLKLGEKMSRLTNLSSGDCAVFLTQSDYLQYDYFTKALAYFRSRQGSEGLFIGGFYVNDLLTKAPVGSVGILRNNASTGLYRWTQNSIAEHQLGQCCFSREVIRTFDFDRIAHFDVLFPVAVILESLAMGVALHRSRHIILRVETGYFHGHYEACARAVTKGFWSQHYELLSNYSHELNGLYDTFHESPEAIAIADLVSGHAVPPVPSVDPAVHVVNQFISQLRPAYHFLRKMKRMLRLGRA